MSELTELYQEIILDHNRRPRHFGALAEPSHRARGYNPLCGDEVEIFLRIADGKVVDATFEGSGCAISTASASLMTEAVRGHSLSEVRGLFAGFHHLMTGKGEGAETELGKLEALAGVREFPMRVKCATLAWHTLQSALEAKVASTESTPTVSTENSPP
ncbi:MAG: Fe-S cluster assembly sulfur transfer protein SufU [Acidobacteriota bacterium]